MDKEEFEKFRDKVYRYLSFRPRSEKEVQDYLKKKKTPPEVFEKLIKLLKEKKLIDDTAFANWWIDQRKTFRPKGKIALKAELKQKGISDQITEEILSQVDELKLARKAAQKKLKIYSRFPPEELYQKISTFLSYRGFSWSTIKEILDSL